ncbi:MAG TPA: hypothetical protein VGH28_02325 [Polyangiaceae bacterium]
MYPDADDTLRDLLRALIDERERWGADVATDSLDRRIRSGWDACEDAKVLLQWAARGLDLRSLVRAACACARTALVHVAADQPRLAIECAEAWLDGKSSAEDVLRASDAAHEASFSAPTEAAEHAAESAALAARAVSAAVAAIAQFGVDSGHAGDAANEAARAHTVARAARPDAPSEWFEDEELARDRARMAEVVRQVLACPLSTDVRAKALARGRP